MTKTNRYRQAIKHVICGSRTHQKKLCIHTAATCSLLLAAQTVFAVGFDQLPALNGPQDAAADAIQGRDINGVRPAIGPFEGIGLCQSIATSPDNASFSAATQELGLRCAELVQTADPRAGGDGTGLPEALNLGVAPADVLAALQQVVPEETEIIGSGATDTSHDQMTNIGSRMQYLRTGSSTLAVSGFNFSGDSLTGGAASADGYSRLGLFINGTYGSGDKDSTNNEAGFDFDAYGITAGIDYRFSEALVAGVAVGFSNSEVEADNNAGETDADGFNGTLYGMYYTETFYVEGTVSFGSYEYEARRVIDYGAGTMRRSANFDSETDGDQLGWSFGGGYTNYADKLNYTLFGRLEGIDSDIDGYAETGSGANPEWAMSVDDQEIESVQAVLGGQLAFAASQSFGVIQPYVSAEWHYEFEDEARDITANYLNDPFFAATGSKDFTVRLVSDDPDQDFYLVSVGVTLIMQGGSQLFLNYDTVLGLDDVSSQAVTAGVRFEF